MITYIDEKTSAQYTALFADASARTGKNITSLETYMANLGDLLTVSPKFVRLPIDEEVFEIDANARTINVPKATFGKYGIGVVGDELAEIVYFKINRFFDIADLANGDKHIIIQWTDAKKQSGYSNAFAVDKDSDPNFIYFGWALNNKITHTAGNITFNVRIFSKGEDNKLVYNLSTQNATVAVKPAQNFDILNNEDLIIDDANTLIAERIVGANIAHAPKIITDLSAEAESGTPLKVVAKADAGANVYAKWFKDNEELSSFVKLTANAEGNFESALTVNAVGEYFVVFMEAVEVIDLKDSEGNKIEYHTTTGRSNSLICKVPLPVKVEIVENLSARYVIGKGDKPSMVVSVPTGVLSGIVLKAEDAKGDYIETELAVSIVNGKASFTPVESGFYKLQVNNTRNGSIAFGDVSEVCRVTEEAKVDSIKVSAIKKDGTVMIEPTSSAKKADYIAGMKLVAIPEALKGSDEFHYQWYLVKGEEDPDDPENKLDLAIPGQTTMELKFPISYKNENNEKIDLTTGAYYVKVTNILNEDVSPERKSTVITLQ